MYKQRALNVLKLANEPVDKITLPMIKKQYYLLALKYHPDKLQQKNDDTVAVHFQEINDAYHYLLDNFNLYFSKESNIDKSPFSCDRVDLNEESNMTSDSKNTFQNMLYDFLEIIYANKESIKKTINKFVEIFNEYKETGDGVLLCDFIKDIKENTCSEVISELCYFLNKYESIFNIGVRVDFATNFLDKILKNVKSTKFYVIEPTLYDVINHNIYKFYLEEFDQYLYVPMWQQETQFTITVAHSSHDDNTAVNIDENITVFCKYNFPNIFIDDENNIYCDVLITFEEIREMFKNNTTQYPYMLANKLFEININTLSITNEPQFIYLIGEGIYKSFYDKTLSNVYLQCKLI